MTEPGQSDFDRREWIQKELAKLDMVQWDRFTVGEDYHGDRHVNVYGWIEREHDEYKDFVLLQCWPHLGENGILRFTTSSDEYSREIQRRLFGGASGHNDCRRVEHTFAIENAVELDPTEQRTLTDGGESQETGSERSRLMRRLIETAAHCARGQLHEDEEHAETRCPCCGESHLGELVESPPEGFYVRYYCPNTDSKGRRSFP